MTLFSIAKKNIKGNLQNYVIYFFSMLLSVVIYFTFVSLQYSKEIQKSLELSQTMQSTFLIASVILILFVAVFILYSNSFFMKKRKKEVGLYSLLGVRKKKIGQMLFYENLIMGAVVLVTGVFLGTLLSKLFSMMLIKLLGSEVEVGLNFSIEAIINTSIVFAVLILFTSIQGYRLIYRFQLIELFQADKEGEQAPKASVIAAGIGVVLLATSYWLALKPFPTDLTNEYLLTNLLMILAGIVIGTFLLFRSVTVFLLRTAQKNKSRYYRGLNLIGTSHLMFRIKGNSRTFTIIALLSAITLSSISIIFSQYYSNAIHANRAAPFSYTHMSADKAFNQKVAQIIESDEEHPITAQMDIPVIKVGLDDSDGTVPDYMAHIMDEFAKEKPFKLVSESTFNTVAEKLERKETVELTGNKAAIIKPLYTDESFSDYEGHSIKVETPEGSRKLEFVEMIDNRVVSWSYPDVYIVISDSVFADIENQLTPIVYKAYEVAGEKDIKITTERLTKLASEEKNQLTSFYTEYKEGLEGKGLYLFTFGFLGLVFLAATGSMIYFKQLTEANSDKDRYEILRKIGVSRKAIRFSLMKQLFVVFALPLVVGVLHSTMIVNICTNLFSNLIGVNVILPILISMTAYVIIYLIYYVFTVNSYNKIVNR
ncbi:ABC transporter permease [Alkalihalobacillus sp. AL-G]|uniref:ABC transporter permease n=1 Tax=Alkalihalobacillus sp. AL-G TaxID=2926399 RepID=UPI00272D1714|nr:ABC transporter permease [Alkalihalobacillus sp. AL-G]WLD94327.1 ABC transporter permease [Alkalihalobacillus sp. AL-G]